MSAVELLTRCSRSSAKNISIFQVEQLKRLPVWEKDDVGILVT